MLPNVMEAFDFYAHRRSNKLQGVSQPSQRRYCQYVDEILRKKVLPLLSLDQEIMS